MADSQDDLAALDTKIGLIPPDGRVVMLSGASRGIGAAIAERLLAEGYRLSLGVRNPQPVHKALPQLAGSTALVQPYDANDAASAKAWTAATADTFGRIDCLINNAGILQQIGFEEHSVDDLDAMWAVNARAPYLLTSLALPHLRQSGSGRIVNIASTDAKRYRDASVSVGYAMTKHALLALTHATRFAGWDDGVRVTALCPGAVATDMVANVDGVVPLSDRLSPDLISLFVSMILRLPNTASVAELPINTRLESTV